MRGRRILYLGGLAAVTAFHLAFGQYISHYMLWFVLMLPVVSLVLSIPAMLCTRVNLEGAQDVQRKKPAKIHISASCSFFLPLDCLKIKVEEQNLFYAETPKKHTFRMIGLSEEEESFSVSTLHCGTVRCSIRSAWAYDYLGFFAFPIKKSNPITFTVLPAPSSPEPMPDLVVSSEQIAKPKPQGFSEEHELRPYREGDSINLIHWKLTSKFDDPIIREPQELIRKNIILAIDLPDSFVQQEDLLDQLLFVSDVLMEKKIPYVLYIGLQNITVRSPGDLEKFLKTFLAAPMRKEKTTSIRTGNDTMVYRLTPHKGVKA